MADDEHSEHLKALVETYLRANSSPSDLRLLMSLFPPTDMGGFLVVYPTKTLKSLASYESHVRKTLAWSARIFKWHKVESRDILEDRVKLEPDVVNKVDWAFNCRGKGLFWWYKCVDTKGWNEYEFVRIEGEDRYGGWRFKTIKTRKL